MPPYLIFSILALLFFSASIIAFKLTAKYFMPNPYAYFFYYFLIYFILGLFLPLFKPIEIIPTNIKQFSYIWPYAIAIFIGMYCFSFSIFKLDITTMAPLGNLSNVFTPILAALFLGEKILSKNYPLFLLVILAGFLAGYDEKLKIRSFFNKYIYLFLVFIFSISLTKILLTKELMQLAIGILLFMNFSMDQ